jgi:hypothetical protein
MHLVAAILGLCSLCSLCSIGSIGSMCCSMFTVKVLHSPLFPSVPSVAWCRLHHVVLFDFHPEPDNHHYRDILMIDYVPDVDITPKVAVKLCMGNTVPGKVRIFAFESAVKKTEILQAFHDKIKQGDFYAITSTTNSTKGPSSSLARYHLYRNNCWRFSKTLMTTRRHFPDE